MLVDFGGDDHIRKTVAIEVADSHRGGAVEVARVDARNLGRLVDARRPPVGRVVVNLVAGGRHCHRRLVGRIAGVGDTVNVDDKCVGRARRVFVRVVAVVLVEADLGRRVGRLGQLRLRAAVDGLEDELERSPLFAGPDGRRRRLWKGRRRRRGERPLFDGVHRHSRRVVHRVLVVEDAAVGNGVAVGVDDDEAHALVVDLVVVVELPAVALVLLEQGRALRRLELREPWRLLPKSARPVRLAQVVRVQRVQMEHLLETTAVVVLFVNVFKCVAPFAKLALRGHGRAKRKQVVAPRSSAGDRHFGVKLRPLSVQHSERMLLLPILHTIWIFGIVCVGSAAGDDAVWRIVVASTSSLLMVFVARIAT